MAWIAAFAVAVGTARVVGGDLATLHRQAHDLGPAESVVVARRDLALGTVVTTRDLRVVTMRTHDAPASALHSTDSATGRVVVVPLLAGGALLARALAPADRTGLDAVVPAGDRAVHVSIADGFRPPTGSVVDVLAAFDPSAVTVDGADGTAVTVARAARVLSVDDDARSDGTTGVGVTLLVTEEEARTVAFAATNADLSLALAPPETACCTSQP